MPWASQTEPTMVTETEGGTKPIHLALVWGFVGIPLAWGVTETLLNALKLFQ
jgi:hypothetical protein